MKSHCPICNGLTNNPDIKVLTAYENPAKSK
jgi:hypothetical protein